MRYPAAETAEKHQRILQEAARLFREQGFDGVSVGQIMQATGLTHGPFYNHFASKEALMAASTLHGSEHSRAALDAATGSPEAMRQYVRDYVSAAHRDARAMAACWRRWPATRASSRPCARLWHPPAIHHRQAGGAFPVAEKRNPRQDAIVMLSAMVGAVALARAVDDGALSDEILAAVQAAYAPTPPAPAQPA
jgi:TetR/AcrR family transcriptional repressor of nem operon